MQRYIILGLFALVVIGCNDGLNNARKTIAEGNKLNIQKIANTCMLFASRVNERTPKDKQELIDYIKNEKSLDFSLELMGIDRGSFENAFVSEVDGEEFIIRYDVKVPMNGRATPVVFESKGIDGIRRVGLTNSRIIEADDVTFKRLMSGKTTAEERGKAIGEEELKKK